MVPRLTGKGGVTGLTRLFSGDLEYLVGEVSVEPYPESAERPVRRDSSICNWWIRGVRGVTGATGSAILVRRLMPLTEPVSRCQLRDDDWKGSVEGSVCSTDSSVDPTSLIETTGSELASTRELVQLAIRPMESAQQTRIVRSKKT